MTRAKRPSLRGARFRRVVQTAVLIAFFAIVVASRPTPGVAPPAWLQAFFNIDPLVLLSSALAAHALVTGLLYALLTIGVTIILGRVFCGWFCPLGTIHALASRLFRPLRPRLERHHWSRWQLAKYYVLGGFVVLAILGVPWLVLVDPLVILYRTTTIALWPATQNLLESGSAAIYRADPHVGAWHLTALSEPPFRYLRDNFFVVPHQAFLGVELVFGFFVLIVLLNLVRPRFWCRYVCPLGGLLGLLAWRPWLRRETAPTACNQCDLCGMTCHGASAATPGSGWKPQECLGCMSCTESCTRAGLKFKLVPPWKPAVELHGHASVESINLSRRGLLGSLAAGAAGAIALRVTPQARGTLFNPDLIRPPGARAESAFLERCLACGMCMKICPTGGLQPSLLEGGLAGLWTPRLVPRLGYCDYECNRCGQVCPTEAIAKLPIEQKKQTRLGLAFIDTTRCLPYAFGRECLVCEEHCPVPDKAIKLVHGGRGMGRGRGGGRGDVNAGPEDSGGHPPRPVVDPDKCIGCGICENVCPFKDRPAIRVTSANESRHPKNQPILPAGNSPYGGA